MPQLTPEEASREEAAQHAEIQRRHPHSSKTWNSQIPNLSLSEDSTSERDYDNSDGSGFVPSPVLSARGSRVMATAAQSHILRAHLGGGDPNDGAASASGQGWACRYVDKEGRIVDGRQPVTVPPLQFSSAMPTGDGCYQHASQPGSSASTVPLHSPVQYACPRQVQAGSTARLEMRRGADGTAVRGFK